MKTWAAACVLSACMACRASPLSVDVPSLDRRDGKPVMQPGFWFPAPTAGTASAPAMLLLHGCGGPYARSGQLSRRMEDYAALLNGEGLHVLVTDSLTPRGEKELCTQRAGTRAVTQTQRRRDALGALQWLAARPEVDATRLGLLGWSNGGSTVLASLQRDHAEVAAATVKPAFAVAFYPGCEVALRQRWKPVAPLLMLLGAADDWTPAAPCEALAAQVNAQGAASAAARPTANETAQDTARGALLTGLPAVQFESYPDAYHDFDGTAALRLRTEVPNGVNPGKGVHIGGNPAAREASRERMLAFVRQAARPQKP